MDGSVQMGAGMLDDVPPKQIKPVLPEFELALHFDAGPAHEGRKVRRHAVGEVHHLAEAPRFRGARLRRRGCCKSGCGRAREKTSPTQSCPNLRSTPGDAHVFSRSVESSLCTQFSLSDPALATDALTQAPGSCSPH